MANESKKFAVVYFFSNVSDVDVDGVFDTEDEAREFIKNYLCEYETGTVWEVNPERTEWKFANNEHIRFVIVPTRIKPNVKDVYGEP